MHKVPENTNLQHEEFISLPEDLWLSRFYSTTIIPKQSISLQFILIPAISWNRKRSKVILCLNMTSLNSILSTVFISFFPRMSGCSFQSMIPSLLGCPVGNFYRRFQFISKYLSIKSWFFLSMTDFTSSRNPKQTKPSPCIPQDRLHILPTIAVKTSLNPSTMTDENQMTM